MEHPLPAGSADPWGEAGERASTGKLVGYGRCGRKTPSRGGA